MVASFPFRSNIFTRVINLPIMITWTFFLLKLDWNFQSFSPTSTKYSSGVYSTYDCVEVVSCFVIIALRCLVHFRRPSLFKEILALNLCIHKSLDFLRLIDHCSQRNFYNRQLTLKHFVNYKTDTLIKPSRFFSIKIDIVSFCSRSLLFIIQLFWTIC